MMKKTQDIIQELEKVAGEMEDSTIQVRNLLLEASSIIKNYLYVIENMKVLIRSTEPEIRDGWGRPALGLLAAPEAAE